MNRLLVIKRVPYLDRAETDCTFFCYAGCSIQLIFHAEEREACVTTYLMIEAEDDFSIDACASQITSMLRAKGFVVNEAPKQAGMSLQKLLSTNSLFAIVKSELAVTSPYSYCGFYYYADRILPNPEQASLAPLFERLLQCPGSTFAVQLVPTQLYEEEQAALSELAGGLDLLCTHGVPGYGGQLIREPYAKEACECYQYYNQLAGQPMFLASMVILSPYEDDVPVILNAVKGYLSSKDGRLPRLECIPVPKAALCLENIGGLPQRVQEYIHINCRNPMIWQSCMNPPIALERLPFLFSREEANRIAALPVADGRTPGIVAVATPMDHSTISWAHLDPNNILLGSRRGYNQVLGCPVNQFAQHMLIVGKPGTGKTTFALNLLLQFHAKNIPFLAIEPTKAEYRGLIDAIPELQIFTPGNSQVSFFSFNPFIPPDDLTVEQYRPALASAFKVAFDMPSPLDTLFENTISQAYAAHGWRSYSKASDPYVRPFGLYEFIVEFKKKLAKQNYSKEVMGNLQSGGTMRLMNLIEQNPLLYDSLSTIPLKDLLSKPTIIEMNSINSQEQKELLMGLLLIQICAYTKHRHNSDGQLRNVILIDEAHVLLDARTSTDSLGNRKENTASITLQNMAAEIRSFGTAIIVADQSAIKIGSGMRANTDIKVAFQLTERAEIEAVSNCTNMTLQQQEALVTLEKGEAYTFFSGLSTPQVIITPDIRKKYSIRLAVSDEEIGLRTTYAKDHATQLKPYVNCYLCKECAKGCDLHEREEAAYLARRLYDAVDGKLTSKEKLFGLIAQYEENNSMNTNQRRTHCTEIQLARTAILDKGFVVSNESMALLFSELWKERD